MAANTTLTIRKSGVSGNVPSALANGELAINYADGKLYYKNATGTITYISSGGASVNSFATINANSSLVLATSNTDTLSFASGNNITISACTTSKIITIALANNVTIPGSLTIGGGTGGSISGATNISSNSFTGNTFTANSTSGATPLTINITATPGNPNAAMVVTGANTKGGVGYLDFLNANNQSGSGTANTSTSNKWFRLSTIGEYQIINSAYTLNIFNVDDSGNMTIPGYFRIGSGYIQFGDGTKQYTANAGGASSDTVARALAQAAYDQANTANGIANVALANTGTVITTNGTSRLYISNTTASTSNTTGALTIAGGLGVSGNAYANAIYTNGLFWAANGQPISIGGSSGNSQFTSTVNQFIGDGANSTFTLSTTPASISYTITAIGGVMQPHSVYSVTSNTITFSSTPTSGVPIEVIVFGTTTGQIYTATSMGNLTLSPFLLMGA